MFLILGLLLTAVLAPGYMSLKLMEVRAPVSVLVGSSAQLSCRWVLGPSEALYAVKWYKDGIEFFRYVPKYKDPIRKFPLPGVEIEENYGSSYSSGQNLTLSSVSLKTSGRYSCEVSGEQPLFQTVLAHADLDVFVPPDHGPVMSGLQPSYTVGNRLVVNCTSGRSHPSTNLTWYIIDADGEPVVAHIIQPQEHTKYEAGLQVTESTLDIVVTEHFFKNNKLIVKCLATLPPFYWKSVEEESLKGRSKIDKHTELRNNSREILEVDQFDTNSSYQSKYLAPTLLLVVLLCFHLQNMN